MLYWVVKAVLTPILRVCFRVNVEGRENLAPRGPVILASNHRSFLDSIFLPLVLRRRVTFVAKAEYFDDPKTAWFFRGVGQIPIRREGGSASERALASATEVLQAGGVFAIYPEGTRTRDGFLHRGHTGVARLCLRTGTPVVPVGLIGTEKVQPIGARLPVIGPKVEVRVGKPLNLSAWQDAPVDSRACRQIAAAVMDEIQQLTGQQYVGRYAPRRDRDLE